VRTLNGPPPSREKLRYEECSSFEDFKIGVIARKSGIGPGGVAAACQKRGRCAKVVERRLLARAR
jgi:hypothetical protein